MKKNEPTIFMFSGQGSQYRGMGRELYEMNPTFRDALDKYDQHARKTLGRSILKEIHSEETKSFDDIFITHPSIVAIELAMLAVMEAEGVKPSISFGSSLGEFAAAVAAGIWSGEQAIDWAINHAAAVEQTRKGGMTSILAKRSFDMVTAMEKADVYLVADNIDNHFTVSGLDKGLSEFEKYLCDEGITYQRLDVRYPFHTPYIAKAKNFLPPTSDKLNKPLICQMYSASYGDFITEAIRVDYFWQAALKPFDFRKAVSDLEMLEGPITYIDLGPSGTMANFVKYNLSKTSSSRVFQLLSPFKGATNRIEALLSHFSIYTESNIIK